MVVGSVVKNAGHSKKKSELRMVETQMKPDPNVNIIMQSFEMSTHWKCLMLRHDSCFHLLTVCLSGAHDLRYLC